MWLSVDASQHRLNHNSLISPNFILGQTLSEKLSQLFFCAAELNEKLWHSGIDPMYMSLKQLADHVTAVSGIQIQFKLVDVETNHILGHVELYDDGKSAIIYIVRNITERFKHAVIAKELCQLLFDTREDWRPDGVDTLGRLVTPIIEIDAPENVAIRSEQLAERLSWELLYPFELRRIDQEKLRAETITLPEIAARVRLPVVIVELLLSSTYMEWCGRWWEITVTALRRRGGAI